MHRTIVVGCFVLCFLASHARGEDLPSQLKPLFQAVDLDIGETVEVTLSDGSQARVKLIDLKEHRDDVCFAVRRAEVMIEVNGETCRLVSANYQLPQTVGKVQIDCPITKGNNENGTPSFWGLDKAARLRLWPAGAPLLQPGTFLYPVKQKWFASDTQMANEPVHVDGGDKAGKRKIYYHSGLDIGGSEGLVEVVAATDSLVVSVGNVVLDEHKRDTPVSPRYDVVYLLDGRGWYYRYSHLKEIDKQIVPGRLITQGDRVGLLGKEGGSGGWSHLHFEISSRQPSGKWGTQEGFAFLREAYQRQYNPDLIAVARPHHLIWAGDSVTLDGSKSWSKSGKIASYQWQFGDGSTADGPASKRIYAKPGRYSEVLRITDAAGHVAYDFAAVIVADRDHPDRHVPSIHPNYYPTTGIRPGNPVTFKVRSFNTSAGKEQWDFGDGTDKVEVHSDGNRESLAPDGYAVTTHRFQQPGDYVVRVTHTDEFGVMATGHLHVHVEGQEGGKPSRAATPPKIDKVVAFDTPEADAILSALQVFPPNNPWNQVVSDWPLHPKSRAFVTSVGLDKVLRVNNDMCYVIVPPNQPKVDVKLAGYPGESDPGPFPVPDSLPIEGWPKLVDKEGKKISLTDIQRRPPEYEADRHAIIVDPVNGKVYEFFVMGRIEDKWAAEQSSIFDLKSNHLRPDGWTSADAAGLPIFPAVIRYDELQRGEITHAMRVTIRRSRKAYVYPATHYASNNKDENLPRMGERFRLKQDFDTSGFSPNVQTILKGLQKYGAFVADNGLEWSLSMAPDPRIPDIHEELRKVKGADFEVVQPPSDYRPPVD